MFHLKLLIVTQVNLIEIDIHGKLEIGKIQISYDNLIKENDILVQKNNMRNEQFSKIKNFFLNQSFNEESDVK